MQQRPARPRLDVASPPSRSAAAAVSTSSVLRYALPLPSMCKSWRPCHLTCPRRTSSPLDTAYVAAYKAQECTLVSSYYLRLQRKDFPLPLLQNYSMIDSRFSSFVGTAGSRINNVSLFSVTDCQSRQMPCQKHAL